MEGAALFAIEGYTIKEKIGSGSFASVWKAEHELTKTTVGIKVIDSSMVQTETQRTLLMREIAILKKLDHPFIAKLFEVIITDSFIFIVLEFAENGSVLDHITNHGPLSEAAAKRMFTQLMSALDYIHEVCHVAHRDVKAENVLLDRHNNVRLIDFGLSNMFNPSSPELSTSCGSPSYTAPEMIRREPYTKAVDLWSAGVLLYAMITGYFPFNGQTMADVLHAVLHTPPKFPSHMSSEIIDLLRQMLCKNQDIRITIAGVKKHQWTRECEFSKFLELDFATDSQWLANTVTEGMAKKSEMMGVDVATLKQSLRNEVYDSGTVVYLMMRRNDITDRICKVADVSEKKNERMVKAVCMSPKRPYMLRPRCRASIECQNVKSPCRSTGTGPPVGKFHEVMSPKKSPVAIRGPKAGMDGSVKNWYSPVRRRSLVTRIVSNK